MGSSMKPVTGARMVEELKEFASFSKATQRYIRCAIDLAHDPQYATARWSRTPAEAADIRRHAAMYKRIGLVRESIPESTSLLEASELMGPLIAITGFDLGQGRLPDFASYRFLYERLIGASVRPWLPGAFCAAAALPHIHPDRRRSLLRSISEAVATAPGWSVREPVFVPEWVEKVDLIAAA